MQTTLYLSDDLRQVIPRFEPLQQQLPLQLQQEAPQITKQEGWQLEERQQQEKMQQGCRHMQFQEQLVQTFQQLSLLLSSNYCKRKKRSSSICRNSSSCKRGKQCNSVMTRSQQAVAQQPKLRHVPLHQSTHQGLPSLGRW